MKSSLSKEDLNRLWSDPKNWTRLGIYSCAADPRTWVLKRGPGIGYTINVAHQSSWLSFLGVLGVAVAPTVASVIMGRRAPGWFLIVQLLVPITLVIVLLVWLGARDRS
jgi:uncharacterized membrane protein